MAFSQSTPTVTEVGVAGGRRAVAVEFTETDGAAASESSFRLPFKAGRIQRVSVEKTSGAAASYTPVTGTATGVAGDDVVHTCGSAATPNETPNSGAGKPFYTASGVLYHRSAPDAGSNNVSVVRYLISEGF